MNCCITRADAFSGGWQVEELEFLWLRRKGPLRFAAIIPFQGDAKILDFRCFAVRDPCATCLSSLSLVM